MISGSAVYQRHKAGSPCIGEVMIMVTFADIFAYSMVIVSVIALCYEIFHKKK